MSDSGGVGNQGGGSRWWEFFSPVSSDFKVAERDFHSDGFDWYRKAAVVAFSMIGGLFFIVGAFPTFRWAVNLLKPGDNVAADKATSATAKKFIPSDEPHLSNGKKSVQHKTKKVSPKDIKQTHAKAPFSPDTTLTYVRNNEGLSPDEIKELTFFIDGMQTLQPEISYVYSNAEAETQKSKGDAANVGLSRKIPKGWSTQAFASYASGFSDDPQAVSSLQKNAEKGFGPFLFALPFANVHTSFHMDEPPITMPDPFPDNQGTSLSYPSVEAYYQNFKRVLYGKTIKNEAERKKFYESCRQEMNHKLSKSDPYAIGYSYLDSKGNRVKYSLSAADQAYWDNISRDVMKGAIYVKFIQNPLLREMLKATHPHTLLQLKTDARWGPGKNGEEENLLGVVLMEVREALIKGVVIPIL